MSPVKTDHKIAHCDDGESHIARQLQDQTENEHNTAGDDALLRRFDAAGR